MYCKFPIPIFHNDKKYIGCEYESPDGGTLANVNKVARNGDFFSAVRSLLIGCISSIKTDSDQEITDSTSLKSLISKLPTRTADTLSTLIMLEYNEGDDGVEGVYTCPRCYNKIISELKIVDGMEIDTRDHINSYPINYYTGETGTFEVMLSKPVNFIDTNRNEVIDEIVGFEMRFPTLEDGINAFQKYGGKDEIRMQFGMFINAIQTVNGDVVDTRWKTACGDLMFEKMRAVKRDIGFITNNIKQYGIPSEVKKTCQNCEKEWMAPLNTSGFFVSALDSI